MHINLINIWRSQNNLIFFILFIFWIVESTNTDSSDESDNEEAIASVNDIKENDVRPNFQKILNEKL